MTDWLSQLSGAVLAMVVISGSISCAASVPASPAVEPSPRTTETNITLPQPRFSSSVSVEESLLARRSVREYSVAALTLAEISQLLWAAQGITNPSGLRTAPSAGALYPLELYIVTGKASGLAEGVYKYRPNEHALITVTAGDVRPELSGAALGQDSVKQAAADIVLSAVYQRTTRKYGERGIRYVHIEVGHAAQNLCLQAAALGLGAVTVGAFDDDQVKKLLKMPSEEAPLYIIAVGKKR